MIVIRGILLLVGVLSSLVGWTITGPYLIMIAIYKPLWSKKAPFIGTTPNRPRFITRFFARVIDYIILSIIVGILVVALETISPTIQVTLERLFMIIFFGYILLSLYFFRKTLGDKILKLELCTYTDDNKISFLQLFIRTFFAPIGAIQGLLSIGKSTRYLVHDRISNTDIIKISRKKNH